MDTVYLDEKNDSLVIIDQSLLPNELKQIRLTEAKQLWDAIYLLKVRGAPAIGVAAALGLYVITKRKSYGSIDALMAGFESDASYLDSARPTAVNLSWAIKRMKARLKKCVESSVTASTNDALQCLHDEALSIYNEDIDVCKRIGENGLVLIKDGYGILTHCNAGSLATVRYGTATAPMYLAHEKGLSIHVFCDETRPLLQGSRLTSFELSRAGIDTTILCDNMVGSLMKSKQVDLVFVGCDRVAANGDCANKIGTSVVGAMAKKYGVPFYVCAPTSTIDMNTKCGDDIVIEQRDANEVTSMWYEKPMVPDGVKVYNPAFDVTAAEDITGIITEKKIAYPPYDKSLLEIMSTATETTKT